MQLQVSVLLPAYNSGKYVTQAIESVLAQTWRDFELIVIDDGSTDNTLEMIQKCAARDSRVKVFTQSNSGLSATLNRGINLVANEWVFRMDNDDLMRPNRIERQLAFIAEHPELSVASSLVRHIDGNDRVIGKDNSKLFTHEAIDKLIASNGLVSFSHPAVAFRRSAVMAVGGYRTQFFPTEDIDLWNRLVENGYKVLVQPEYLLDYRMHGNSATISGQRLTIMKLHWLKDCALRRRAAKPELTLEEFLAERRAAPWLTRLNRSRKDLAKIFYKAAVFHYAQRQYPSLFFKLLLAVGLQPATTLAMVASKFAFGSQAEDV
jgi:glycosyltransferase involved in cell wall biosynthesis